MKRLIYLSLLLISSLISYADNWSRLGYKGKVTKTTIFGYGSGKESFTFDISGNLLGITTDCYNVSFSTQMLTRTSTGFSGTCKIKGFDGKISITTGKKGITKIYIKYDTGSLTVTNSYDSKGKLTKKVYEDIWYTEEEPTYDSNIGSELNRYSKNQSSTLNRYGNRQQANLNRLQKKINDALAKGDMAAYQRARDEYMKASNDNANDYMNESETNSNSYMSNVHAGFKKKKVKHTNHNVCYFSDYDFDEFGNWTSRTVSLEKDEFGERQTIVYDSEYWSKYFWGKLKPEGDLRKIESFAMNPNCYATYKDSAVTFWNERILKEIKLVYNNNIDSLCKASKSPIITDLRKDSALNIVREDIYSNQVLSLRDFNTVRQMKDMVYCNIPIFDKPFQEKIMARSEELRKDSVLFLTTKAQKELDSEDNNSALITSNTILLIDKDNANAINIGQEASYRLIVEREHENTVTEADYISFLDTYPSSIHSQEMQNNRALFASNLFNEETSNEELERVNALPTDESTHKIVSKRYKKWKFKNNRGRFFHIGLGGEFAYGPVNTVVSGELTTRFGYTANLLNLTVGLKYNYLTSSSQMFKSPKESGKAYFERQYLSVPIMLRLNFLHGYNGSSYFAVGTELNINTLSAKLRDVEDIKEKNFANDKFSITPRIALGGRFYGIEIELFATYDVDNPFNVDYIKDYKLKSGQNIKTACDESAYDKQINGEDFFDKVRGGIALRLWF